MSDANYDYLIVTSAPLASTFERLANWRTLMGLKARVVTVEDIVAGTVPDTGGATFWHNAGYFDGSTRDEAEAIRNFIKWANVNWLTDYVLLGGDTEVIPRRQALHTGGGAVGTIRYGDIDLPDTSYARGFSPVASSVRAGTSVNNVLNEDPGLVWMCAVDDPDPWIRITVGFHWPVNRVTLIWGDEYATSYTVQVSIDGINWTDVYTTNTGAGGREDVGFPCASATYLRLKINSGTDFSLVYMRAFSPSAGWYGGAAYRISDTVTRILKSTVINPNPANSPDGDQILIAEGPHTGVVIPYDEASDDATLGWHFVQDLPGLPGAVIPEPDVSSFIEIRGPAEYHGNVFVVKADINYIATDLYYSDIQASEYPPSTNHDWDADGNGIYGERYNGELDGVNGIADTYLGRAPVETVQEADNFIDKVINYELFVTKDEYGIVFLLPEEFAVSVLLGSQNWSPQPTDFLDQSAAGKENIRSTFLGYDPSRWIFTRRYQDYEDVPAEDQAPDLRGASKESIMDAIGVGQNIVSLSSHGSEGYLCYLYTDDVDDVANHPSIFYGNACSTNKFDAFPGGAGEALSEWTILNQNGGAVAYVGNSRFGWTSDNPIELAFWEESLQSERLGEMFDACKLVIFGWQSYSLNLLGDPAMRVWSDRPKRLEVTHPEHLYSVGQQTIQVNVATRDQYGALQPVQDALACVTMGGSLFAASITDGSGTASIPIGLSVTGTLRVTVSGKDLLPYLGTVTVSSQALVEFLDGSDPPKAMPRTIQVPSNVPSVSFPIQIRISDPTMFNVESVTFSLTWSGRGGAETTVTFANDGVNWAPESPTPTQVNISNPVDDAGAPVTGDVPRAIFDGSIEATGEFEQIRILVNVTNLSGNTTPPVESSRLLEVAIPSDILLLLDYSGSMLTRNEAGQSKWESAKEAGNLFNAIYAALDSAALDNRIALVRFFYNGYAGPDLTEVTEPLAPPNLQPPLVDDPEPSPMNFTPMGSAIIKGHNEAAPGAPNWRNRVMILLTDGMENRRPMLAEIRSAQQGDPYHVPSIEEDVQLGYRIHACAFGPPGQVDTDAIQALAMGGDGLKSYSGELHSTESTSDPNEAYELKEQFLFILADTFPVEVIGPFDRTFVIDPGVSDLVCVVTEAVGFTVTPPPDNTAPIGSVNTQTGFSWVHISDPTPGTWELGGFTPSSTVKGFAVVDLKLRSTFEASKDNIGVGLPIPLRAEIREEGVGVPGATVKVDVEYVEESIGLLIADYANTSAFDKKTWRAVSLAKTPREPLSLQRQLLSAAQMARGFELRRRTETVTLSETAAPGVYKGVWSNTHEGGTYTFRFKATGLTSSGHPFERDYVVSRHVEPVPDPQLSEVVWGPVSLVEGRKVLWKATLTPRTASGRPLGPGLEQKIRVLAEGRVPDLTKIGTLKVTDNFDGTYGVTLELPVGVAPPSLRLNYGSRQIPLASRPLRSP